MYDVIILGCGVVGAAAAYHLAQYPLNVAILEAQNDVANGTTKANSAIIHAGYDPEPGTLMARLNVEGNRMAGDICQKLQVPFARVGSLVLAFDEGDLHTLRTLYDRGVQNGVPGLELAAFIDVGAAKDLATRNNDIDHLAGWGLGLRYSKQNDWYAQFDFARKINGRPDSDGGDDDFRLWFQVYKIF